MIGISFWIYDSSGNAVGKFRERSNTIQEDDQTISLICSEVPEGKLGCLNVKITEKIRLQIRVDMTDLKINPKVYLLHPKTRQRLHLIRVPSWIDRISRDKGNITIVMSQEKILNARKEVEWIIPRSTVRTLFGS